VNAYDTTSSTDRHGSAYVRFWDVYKQVWARAYCSGDVSIRSYVALPAADRALIDALPSELPDTLS